jgi:hypothetical protein
VLPAISLDGILAVKIVEGSFNTERFKAFIDGLLDHMTPFPGPNSVIIMDNCRIHHARSVREMIEERSEMLGVRELCAPLMSRLVGWCASSYPATHQILIPLSLPFPNSKPILDDGNTFMLQWLVRMTMVLIVLCSYMIWFGWSHRKTLKDISNIVTITRFCYYNTFDGVHPSCLGTVVSMGSAVRMGIVCGGNPDESVSSLDKEPASALLLKKN